MKYVAGFVAAVLEGFEVTIGELREGTREDQKVLAGLDVLQAQVASLRKAIDEDQASSGSMQNTAKGV